MANAIFNNICVSGIACAVPKEVQKTIEYESEVGTEEVREFMDMTGVQQRHVSIKEQTSSDLCYVAADRLLSEKQIDRNSIDAIIFYTQYPDYSTPATAHVLHKRLGLPPNCMAFDVNLGCSAYVYGLYLASTMLQSSNINRILVLVGDVADRNPEILLKKQMLFGSAGSATLIESGDTTMKCLLKADGEGYSALITPGGRARNPIIEPQNYWKETVSTMDGIAVYEFTITQVPKSFKEFFKLYETSVEDYDYCILHQANYYMLKHIAKKIKLPLEKMPITIDRYGNTAGSSAPLTIVDLCQEKEVPEKLNLITAGFGIGLSWGVVSFEIDSKNVLPMIITDDYYKEAYRG